MNEPMMPPWLSASCPTHLSSLMRAQLWIWGSMPPALAMQISEAMTTKLRSGALPNALARELALQLRDAAAGVLRAAVRMFALSSVVFEALGEVEEARTTFGRAREAYEPLLDEAFSELRQAAFDPTPIDVMGTGAN